MKPNTRIIDYTVLIQDGVLTLDDIPQDIKSSVTKWVRYLSGVTDNGMVKEDTATPTVSTTPAPTPAAVVTKPILPKVGD
ncbi:hypothetical protein [Lactobacillus crispatus]|uniref:Uncharacterized protein n=1 Tax=Lactobacillus crispatus TaxID=47770 RepID=A0A7H9E830_9LACO|nr:hypothetical protein [Lactobacillus crispatus]QLL73803.1 hypothetical protein GTO85_05180 [Lactobacillus crispatus]